MKNKIFCILVVLMTSFYSFSQDYINSDIDCNTTWTDQGTTPDYVVENDISITNTAILTIDEDVVVRFEGNLTVESESQLYILDDAYLEFGADSVYSGGNYYYDGYQLIVEGILIAVDDDADGDFITFTKTSGFRGWGGIIFKDNDGSSQLDHCRISATYKNNDLVSGNEEDYCGAIYIESNDESITIEDCEISYNYALYGGGLYCEGVENDVIITGCEISYNYAVDDGGGVHIMADGDAEIYSTIIEYNEAHDGDGGGVCIYNSEVVIDGDCEISNNEAEDHGGGIYISGADVTINETDFEDNECNTGNGGAVYNYYSHTYIALGEFWDNAANSGDGGAIYNYNSDLDLINNLIVWNTGGNGGAIFHYSNQGTADTVRINNNTIAKNEEDAGGGIYSDTMGSRFSVVNTIIWDNLGNSLCDDLSNLLPDAMFSYCDIEDGNLPSSGTSGSYYSFSDDPEFVSNYDFRVHGTTPVSPCLDAGLNSATHTIEDLDGDDRVDDGNGDLTDEIDIGAYENIGGTDPSIMLSIDDYSDQNILRVYPTIVENQVTILCSKIGLNLSIYSIDGRLVMTFVNKELEVKLDCNAFETGTYFVSLNDNNVADLVVFIKQ
jgi:hypothetical protein